jgi:uncharacterized membrane protein (DUF373 family)
VLLSLILIYSLFEFALIVFRAALNHHDAFNFGTEPLIREELFLSHVKGLISAILLLAIIIECIHSLVEHSKEGSANYVFIITEIALIAVVRHILALDIEHINPHSLLGLSTFIFMLGLFYLNSSNRIVVYNKV